jgi:uncharacterized protein (TIGR01777 family)
MRIIIAGGSGLIGRELARELLLANHEVVVLSRNPGKIAPMSSRVKIIAWDGKTPQGWGQFVEGTGALVNLAGANIAGEGFFPSRWTEERKQNILQSRLNAGRAISDAIAIAKEKPRVLVQSSAIGFYGPLSDQAVDENGKAGIDFVARICQEWEQSTAAVEALGVRRVVVRSGIVLTNQGGALTRMLLPYKLYVGGPFGNGKQVISWIHINDEVSAIGFLIDTPTTNGVYNLTAPNPTTNAEMGRTIGRIMRRPYYLPVPAFAMRLLFGEVATVVLDGQRVLPNRLLEGGFEFKFPRIDMAIGDIIR